MKTNLYDRVRGAWKTVVGFVAPAAVVLGAAVQPGSPGGTSITQAELVEAVVAAVVTAGGVYAKRNTGPKAPKP